MGQKGFSPLATVGRDRTDADGISFSPPDRDRMAEIGAEIVGLHPTSYQKANYSNMYDKTEWQMVMKAKRTEAMGERSRSAASAGDLDLEVRAGGERNICMQGHLAPELFVIGAIKGSTTSLCLDLSSSPGILWPTEEQGAALSDSPRQGSQPEALLSTGAAWKEGHFFDEWALSTAGNHGLKHITLDYPACRTDKRLVAAEGSARYSTDPAVPYVIADWYGAPKKNQLKFAFLLRDPVARLHSHYYHSRREGWCNRHKTASFAQIVDQIVSGKDKGFYGSSEAQSEGCGDFLEGSMYTVQLKRWLWVFQPSQFMIIPFLFNVAPGTGSRPTRSVAESIWDNLGVRGVQGKGNSHANKAGTPHPKLSEDLDSVRLHQLTTYMNQRTGAQRIAYVLSTAGVGANLYGYKGQPWNAVAISRWLQQNW